MKSNKCQNMQKTKKVYRLVPMLGENLTRRQVKTNINNKESGPGNDLLQYTFYKCSLYISA